MKSSKPSPESISTLQRDNQIFCGSSCDARGSTQRCQLCISGENFFLNINLIKPLDLTMEKEIQETHSPPPPQRWSQKTPEHRKFHWTNLNR